MNNNTIAVNQKIERNYGIDLLRIISMLMIVLIHVLGDGGLLKAVSDFSIKYEITWLLNIAVYCAVNCYALISGYVGVSSRYKYSNLILLWIKVALYSGIITLVFKMFAVETINLKGLIMSFFPLITNRYWYFTAYFFLFLIIPFLNYSINTMGERVLRIVLVVVLFFTSIFAPLADVIIGDIWYLSHGFSALWLIVLYLLGGYIRKYGLFNNVRRLWFVITYVISILFMFFLKNLLHFGGLEKLENSITTSYLSLPYVIAAVSLLYVFKKDSSPLLIKKIIMILTPLSFSVYLIHKQVLIEKYFIEGKMTFLADLNPFVMIITIIGLVILIFVLCCAIDGLREVLFRLLKIKERVTILEIKIFNRFGVNGEKE